MKSTGLIRQWVRILNESTVDKALKKAEGSRLEDYVYYTIFGGDPDFGDEQLNAILDRAFENIEDLTYGTIYVRDSLYDGG